MDKSLFVYILIGIGFFYVVTDFVGGIQEEDDRYRNNQYTQEHQYDKYQSVDSAGESVLNVSELDLNKQVLAWNASPLKEEWIALFPDFSAMKMMIKERVQGTPLTTKLISLANEAEDKYFSGALTVDGTKQLLGSVN
jgi:hypothetical protein